MQTVCEVVFNLLAPTCHKADPVCREREEQVKMLIDSGKHADTRVTIARAPDRLPSEGCFNLFERYCNPG